MTHELLILATVLCAAMMSGAAAATSSDATSQPATRAYAITGEVEAVDRATSSVTLHHDEIPGLMPAMTMPFSVREPSALDGLNKGDRVAGQLVVTEDDSFLTTLSVTSRAIHPTTTTLPEAGPTVLVQDEQGNLEVVTLLREGDLAPHFAFTDQTGTTRTLEELRGKAIGITFVYTRCPLPNFCPALSRNFAKVQELLKADPVVYDKTHLLSVTIDPDYDTPRVLKDYAAAQKADTRHWSFVNGGRRGTKDFARRVDLTYGGSGTDISHNMRSIIIAPDGKLVKKFTGSAWDPKEFAAAMKKALAPTK
jgi:protein SCO1/2